MVLFRKRRRIRFSETDYAGIMFYPRYIEALNDVVEDWFRDVAGISFDRLLDDFALGSPLISLDTQFLAPNRLGDEIDMTVYPEHLGSSSIRFRVEATSGEEIRARSNLTHVCVSRDVSQSVPWPDEVRAMLEKEFGD